MLVRRFTFSTLRSLVRTSAQPFRAQPASDLFSLRVALALFLAFVLVSGLAACGGGGGDAEPTPVVPADPIPPITPVLPPVVNQPPVAEFAAPATASAGVAVVLDGRASRDPEGSALVHSWDFGDGVLGGVPQLAHIYSQAGTYTATLTVTDPQGARGTTTRQIRVLAAAPAAREVTVAGLITDPTGAPLAGVNVTVVNSASSSASAATATSNAQGRVSLALGVGVDVVLRLSRSGYADQVKVLNLPSTVGVDAYFEAALLARGTPQTLADAAAGGTVAGTQGASLILPPAALVNSSGTAVTGAVQVTLTPVDVNTAAIAGFPGRFEGVLADGTRTPIVSYGTTEFSLSQGGQPLQLKAGARATVLLPIYASQNLNRSALAVGDSVPLWSLDERSGQWVLEGTGEVVAAPDSPVGLALRAQVGHLSWWNADRGFNPYRPRPSCFNDVPGQYDNLFAQAIICKMLADMDKGGSGQQSEAQQTLVNKHALLANRAAADARPLATVPRFPLPGFRYEADVPLAGGQAIDVPPDQDVALNASALNGTWRGRTVVRGAEGATAAVAIGLRPVAAGGNNENITLPFDQVRAASALRIDRYRFDATAQDAQGVELQVAPAASSLTGTLRVLSPTGVLIKAAAFGGSTTATVLIDLATTGTYVVEVVPETNAPGGYRLQAALKTQPVRSLPSSAISLGAQPSEPKVAVNASGTTVAVWLEFDDTSFFNPVVSVFSSRYNAATSTWGAPLRLTQASESIVDLQVGIDDAGNVTAAWWQASAQTGPYTVRYAAATSSWGSPQVLASAACAGTSLRLAVAPQGTVHMAWRRSAVSNSMCTRTWPAGATGWAAEQQLAVPASVVAFGLADRAISLATQPDGRAVLAWVVGGVTEPASALLASRYSTTTGQWAAPVAAVTGGVLAASAAIGADGGALLVWRARDQGQAAAWWPSGQALPNTAKSLTAAASQTDYDPQPIALWRGGSRLMAVWQAQTPVQQVQSATFDSAAGAGGTWGSTAVVGSNTEATLLGNASADADGRVVVVRSGGKATVPTNNGRILVLSRFTPAVAPAVEAWADSARYLSLSPLVGNTSGVVNLSLAGNAITAVWVEGFIAPRGKVVAAKLPALP